MTASRFFERASSDTRIFCLFVLLRFVKNFVSQSYYFYTSVEREIIQEENETKLMFISFWVLSPEII